MLGKRRACKQKCLKQLSLSQYGQVMIFGSMTTWSSGTKFYRRCNRVHFLPSLPQQPPTPQPRPRGCALFISAEPALASLALKHIELSSQMFEFLDRRHRNAVEETEVGPTASVTTGLIILLKATAHGQDLRRVVQDIDTVEWETGHLAKKLKRTLSKLAEKPEQNRMLRAIDTDDLLRCLNRPLAEKYECMPVQKKGAEKDATTVPEVPRSGAQILRGLQS